MRLVPIAIALLAAAPAAAELPQFDIRAYCAGVGAQMGGSKQFELICVQEERAALAALQATGVEPGIARYCAGVAETMGGSYQFAKICVDEERSARERLAARALAAQ